MGLDINSTDAHGYRVSEYTRLGSYGRIHVLRKWLLVFEEGNPQELVDKAYNHRSGNMSVEAWKQMTIVKYPRIIDHSDCDGGYISYSNFGIKSGSWEWQDLDELRKELEQCKAIGSMPDEVREVLQDFDKIVNMMSENETTAKIIYFT